jgi:hypothetical protein
MNNNQMFDEHIKEQLKGFAPVVHPRIWENIVAGKEKRKPVGFWLRFLNGRNVLALAVLLLAGGAGLWLVLKNSTGTDRERNSSLAVADNKKASEFSMPSAHVKDNPSSGPFTPGNTAVTPDNLSIVNAQNNKFISNDPFQNPRSLASPSFLRTQVKAPGTETIDNDDVAGDNNSVSPAPVTFNGENGSLQQPANDNTPAYGGSLLGRLIFGAQKIGAEHRSKENKMHLALLGFLPDCPAFEKNAAGNKRYLEFYAGPDLALRSLSDTGNSTYLQKRKESSKVTSAFSAGIRYTRVFNNSMSLRTGINYSQINEKFTYVQGNLVQVTYIIDVNGDTTGSYITTGTRYKTTYNKYRSIDVPLLLGYEVGNGKLHANINLGPVVNVYSWQKGEVLDTSLQPVSITTGKGNSPYQFKTNAGFGVMGAVSLYYKLNEKVHAMAEPYFRYNLTQLNKENLTLKQKFNTVGLKLGLRVDLK